MSEFQQMDGSITTAATERPTLTMGRLGVEVPPEFEMDFSPAIMGFMRDMRLDEIERRILAIEARLPDPPQEKK